MKRFLIIACILAMQGAAHAADRLRCGVVTEPLDWNKSDLHADLSSLGAQMCRAIATARFGAPDRLAVQPYTSEETALLALKAGSVDVVAGVTPSFTAAAADGVRFSIPFFYDGQGFMVHEGEGVKTVADIAGHKLCYIEDTDNDPTGSAYLSSHGISYVPFGFQEEGEMDAAIMDRHCQVVTAYISKMAEARATFHDHKAYSFLPVLLNLAPLTIASGAHDQRLAGIVDATISVLLQAEFLGVTQAKAAAIPQSPDPRMQRLLGQDFATAAALDLPHDWSLRLIEALGNYSEIYDRTVGPGTELDLPRGRNALWSEGGLLVPLPLK